MSPIVENIMALAEQYASAAWHHLSLEESKKRHEALRAAIEQALNTCGSGAGCLYKEARIEALEQALGQGERLVRESMLKTLAAKGCGNCYPQDCQWPDCSPKAKALLSTTPTAALLERLK